MIISGDNEKQYTYEPLISVIVPVYNVEKYLVRCIESILVQTYTTFELILIDDGSPDSCGNICDCYAEKDSRIRVIHKSNQGVSAARNTGLDNATGEYIAFIDSDDWIHEKYLFLLLNAMISTNSYMSVCGYVRTNNEHALEEINCSECIQTLKSTQLLNSHEMKSFTPRRLYKKELLSNIRFNSNVMVEDALFNTEVIAKNPVFSVAYIPIPLYAYYTRDGSLTSIFRPEDYSELGEQVLSLAKETREKDMSEVLATESMKRFLHARFSLNRNKNNAGVKKCNELMRKAIGMLSGKNKWKYRIMLYCPIVYYMFRIIDDPTLLKSRGKA